MVNFRAYIISMLYEGIELKEVNIMSKKLLSFMLALFLLLGSLSLAEGTLPKEEIDKIVNTTTDPNLVESPVLKVAKQARESIVGIHNYQKSQYNYYNYRGDRLEPQDSETRVASGSGVVVSKYGHIITNYHVVDGASRLTVSVNGKEYPASLVASDPSLDLAVLYCHGLNLPAAQLGDSDKLQVGEYAIVIGNPLSANLERTVTAGFVSGLDREISDRVQDKYGRISTTKNKMIQVDAAINSGNSGGGMFNSLGQLMGIPSIKLDNSDSAGMMGFVRRNASIDNIGMCIPINAAKPLLREVLANYDSEKASKEAEELKEKMPSSKPRMGITIENVVSERSGLLPNGARILDVEDGSPAQEAGLKKNDIIVELNGKIISNIRDLAKEMQNFKANDTVSVKVFRQDDEKSTDGKYIDYKVTLKLLDIKN